VQKERWRFGLSRELHFASAVSGEFWCSLVQVDEFTCWCAKVESQKSSVVIIKSVLGYQAVRTQTKESPLYLETKRKGIAWRQVWCPLFQTSH
jgi:hypothetical protein